MRWKTKMVNTMNRFIWLILALIALGCSQDEKGDGVKLMGNLEQFPSGGFAYLEYIGENGVEPFDTLEIDENGNFEAYLAISEPAFYRLNFNGRQIISIILTGEEQEVEVNAHGNDPQGFSEISGSYDTEYKRQMDIIMQDFQQQIQNMRQTQMQARNDNDAATFRMVQVNMQNVAKGAEAELKRIIKEASPSLAAFYGIQMIDAAENVTFIDSIAMELREELPDNFHVMALVSEIETKKSLAIGRVAPEISLQNPDGEIIKLSSLRGNYVLIDFWAAWCRPCRAENPNLVRAYQKYQGENFEILQVSLDRTRDKWLAAIEQDGLPWVHVSDLKYWRSQAALDYQVGAIPASFLIDPEGKIIAKNLRGVLLEAKLKEIFG